ncbi:MAG TPA: class IV adenylate cyclase [Blastocatellia bacterium]|nr:class IV adenylate cyclase [Blastocatellia bacterium]
MKLRCADFAAFAHAGITLEVERARHFEDNWLLDTPAKTLVEKGSTLRVRIVEGEGLLTLKEKADRIAPASQFKVRIEIETSLGEPQQALEIFERLGYQKSFRYQKYRTVYSATLPGNANRHLKVMFDETPLGEFVELEGEEEAIQEAVELLGFKPEDYILESYVALQAAHCRKLGRALEDMVFSRTGEREIRNISAKMIENIE